VAVDNTIRIVNMVIIADFLFIWFLPPLIIIPIE